MGGYEWAAAVAAGILARLGARLILQLHLGRATLNKKWRGCEFWHNRNESIWFVKCTRCPAVGGFLSSRAAADGFAVRHIIEVHDIGQQH